MKVVSSRVRGLKAYVPGEQPDDTELVKLNTNENPYPPSPAVAEAVAREAQAGLHLYPSATAAPLRQLAAKVYDVPMERILVGNGSDDLLAICLRACVLDGATVAYPVPTYSLYRTLAEAVGGVVREIPATPGKIPDELFDVDAAVTFLCTPNPPHGDALDPSAIGEFADSVEGLVVADEAYIDFGGASSIGLLEGHPNLVVTRSFSKSFSLAGLRLGLAFCHEDLVRQFIKVKDSYNVSRLTIAAGVAALEDYAHMEENVRRVKHTRSRVVEAVRAAGFTVPESSGNFFWLDCPERGGRAIYESLRERGVLVRFFAGGDLEGGVRVTVGTDAQMDRFLDALLTG